MPYRTAARFFQELSFLAFIPLSFINIDADGISKIITTVMGLIAGIYAVRFYSVQIEKSKAEKRVAELEAQKLEKELYNPRKPKRNQDDEP